MSLSVAPTMMTLALSVGSRLDIPATRLRGIYPPGTVAWLVIEDDAGAELAAFDGDVTATGISFSEDPEDVNDIPHGANFRLFVQRPNEAESVKAYGTVVRAEPRYPLKTTVVSPEDAAKQYTANFQQASVGPKWKSMGGSGLAIHNWGVLGRPNTLGPNYTFNSAASARWLYEMNMDSITVVFRVWSLGAGKMNVLVCGDYALNSYVGIQFDTGPINNRVRVITGAGPLSWHHQGSSVNNTVGNGEYYTLKYFHPGKQIALYKGTNLTPLISWVDESNIVPHGEGFRYTGLSWNTSVLTPGVEPSEWEARDGV
ncbi:DUF7264 domain-containing protein [Mycolicibacterium sphagni]|uniref:LtfC/p132/Gp6 beta-sandwich domain-containing protein n=1 Tax=Mycolicibacterium sphagni TaxID=1786 RepID=A0A255DRS5_9MYCO|nr:hypothetical protein [Mycolicibacterium sphagni]OYN81790.1 hypothetical protein CG716_05460 [Mycolicibacterium sphagni]